MSTVVTSNCGIFAEVVWMIIKEQPKSKRQLYQGKIVSFHMLSTPSILILNCSTSLYREVLNQIHAMEPPGRFLLKNYSTYAWDIVSPAVAREKCCQVGLFL